MMVSESIFQILSNPVISVPPERIKVPGTYSALLRPYIIHRPISLEPTHTHSGLESLRIWNYQFNVICDSFAEGVQICEELILRLKGTIDGVSFFLLNSPYYSGQTNTDDNHVLHTFMLEYQISEGLI